MKKRVMVLAMSVLEIDSADKLEMKPVRIQSVSPDGKKTSFVILPFVVEKRGLAASAKAAHGYLDRLIASSRSKV